MCRQINLLGEISIDNIIASVVDDNENFMFLFKDGTFKFGSIFLDTKEIDIQTYNLDLDTAIKLFTTNKLFSKVNITGKFTIEKNIYTVVNTDNVFVHDEYLEKIVEISTDMYFV
jgi:hypothetical protein